MGFLGGVLEAVEVLLHRLLPIQTIPLIDRIDGARARHAHVRVRQYELAEGIIHREAINTAAAHRDDELGRSAVHREPRGDELGAGDQEVLFRPLGALGQLEDAEDGADGDAGVEVGGAVDRVADHGVPGVGRVGEDDGFFFLFGDEDAAFAGCAHRADEEVVADDVELLLVVAGGVGGAGEAGQVDEGGAADVVGDGFEGELEGVAEEAGWWLVGGLLSCGFEGKGRCVREVARSFFVFGLLFGQEAGEGDDVGVDLLVGDGRGLAIAAVGGHGGRVLVSKLRRILWDVYRVDVNSFGVKEKWCDASAVRCLVRRSRWAMSIVMRRRGSWLTQFGYEFDK